MIVTEFQIDRYRGGHPLRVLDLGNGLNVALVDDRIGQRKMLDIVPTVLYGSDAFSLHAAAAPLPATIGVRTDNGVFRIHRKFDDEHPSGQSFTITSPDNTIHESEFLKTLVDGIGREKYRRVFTLKTTRLVHEIRQGRGNVVGEIVRLTRFLKRRSPPPAVAAPPLLPTEPFRRVDRSLTELSSLLSEQAQKDQHERPAQVDGADAEQAAADLKNIDREIDAAQTHDEQLEREIQQTRFALTTVRLQSQLNQINDELAAIREVPQRAEVTGKEPEVGIEQLEEKLSRCRQRLAELVEEKKDLQEQIDDAVQSSRIRPLLPRVKAVLLQEKFLITEEEAIAQLADHIGDLEARLETEKVKAQSRATELTYQQTQATQALGEIDRFVEQIRLVKREYRETVARFKRTNDVTMRRTATRSIAVDRSAAAANALAADENVALHDVEQRVRLLRERLRLDQQLSDLQADRQELDELAQRLYADQLVPFRILMWLGVPFMTGVAMVIYGLFMSQGGANWKFVGFGLVFALATSMFKISLDHVNSQRLAATRRQLAEMDRDISEFMHRADELDAQLPETVRPLAHQLEEAERQLASLPTSSGHVPISVAEMPQTEASVNQLRRTVDSADSRLFRRRALDARKRYREMIDRWREFLLDLGLAPTLSPTDARQALEQRSTDSLVNTETPDRVLEFQLLQLRNDLERRRATFAESLGHARQLVQDLGFSVNGSSTGEQLDILRESMQDYEEEERSQAELAQNVKQLCEREAKLRNYGQRLSVERKKRLAEERRRLEKLRSQKQLRTEQARLRERQRDQLAQRLEALAVQHGNDACVETLAELSSGELDSRLENLVAQQQSVRQQLKKKHECRGETRQRLSQASRTPPAEHEIAWTELLKQTDELAERWQDASVETDRQVAALEVHRNTTGGYKYLDLATDYLNHLNHQGFAGMDYHGPERGVTVANREGQTISVRKMPPRQMFDLFLSLWLARLEVYADQGIQLPIVLDDPLAAAKPSRRKAMAKLLSDFAATGHQLLLITTEPEHADVFAELEVPIADFGERDRVRKSAAATTANGDHNGTNGSQAGSPRNGHAAGKKKRQKRKKTRSAVRS